MVAKTAIPLLIAGMLITGVANSLFSKWQDMQCVERCDNPDPSEHVEFSQPVLQTLQMFLGECLCLLPVIARIAYQRISQRARAERRGPISLSPSADGGASEPLLPKPIDNGADQAGASGANGNATKSTKRVRMQGGTETPTQEVTPGQLAEGTEELTSQAPAPARPAGPPKRPSLRRRRTSKRKIETKPLTGRAIFLFVAPALCDICGTTLMNVGLLFTPVSIYQMTRGALVLWVGIFSVIFLRRYLFLFQWLSLVTVMSGVCVVGLSGTILKSAPNGGQALAVVARAVSEKITGGKGGGDDDIPEGAEALLGVVLILFAQLFTASQFVLEEKIMSRYSVEPLLAVGYEGLFGFLTVLFIMPILHIFIGSKPAGRGGYFDMRTGWAQMISNEKVLWSSVAIALSIAFFNFFGLSVTRSVSATARSTIDTSRTLGIWIVSLTLGWEVFLPTSGSLQVLGFVLLVYGTFVFNGIVRPPPFLRPSAAEMRASKARSGASGRSKSYRRSKSHRGDPNGNGAAASGSGGGGGDLEARREGDAGTDAERPRDSMASYNSEAETNPRDSMASYASASETDDDADHSHRLEQSTSTLASGSDLTRSGTTDEGTTEDEEERAGSTAIQRPPGGERGNLVDVGSGEGRN